MVLCNNFKKKEIEDELIDLLDPNKRIQVEINANKFNTAFLFYNQNNKLTHRAISIAQYLTIRFKERCYKYHNNNNNKNNNIKIKRGIDFLALCPIYLNNKYLRQKMQKRDAKIAEKYEKSCKNKKSNNNKERQFIADIFWRKNDNKSIGYKKETNIQIIDEIVRYFQGRKLIHKDVVIGNIFDPNHPCKQIQNDYIECNRNVFGLFAINNILQNQIICLYNGQFNIKQEIYNKYTQNDEDQFRLYTMEYIKDKDDSNSICIDSNIFCNHGVLINDPKNHNKQNEANVIYKEGHIDGIPFVALITSKSIKKGEELLTDYSDAFWKHYKSYHDRIKNKDKIIDKTIKKENKRKRKLETEMKGEEEVEYIRKKKRKLNNDINDKLVAIDHKRSKDLYFVILVICALLFNTSNSKRK